MAVQYRGDKYGPNDKIFRVGIDSENKQGNGLAAYAANSIKPNVNDGYKPWRSPSSDGKGELFYTKYDKKADTNYLYSATINTRRTTPAERNTLNVMGQTPGAYAGMDYVQETTYHKVGPAPGENPQGTRQPERAKKRNSDGDGSKGGSYATKRNKAGAKSTILTGARGLLGSGVGGNKTLLGN